MVRLHELFCAFFKIGAFTIGGGYAMIPLMEKEIVDKRQWIEKETFMDMLAVAQSLPGIFAANMATAVGNRLRGWTGAVTALIANVLCPIFLILTFAIFFRQFRDNAVVESMFKAIRPAVVALIAAPVFTMARTAKLTVSNCWIPVVAALLIWLLGVSPVLVIVAAAAGGFLYGQVRKERQP